MRGKKPKERKNYILRTENGTLVEVIVFFPITNQAYSPTDNPFIICNYYSQHLPSLLAP